MGIIFSTAKYIEKDYQKTSEGFYKPTTVSISIGSKIRGKITKKMIYLPIHLIINYLMNFI